MARRSSSPGGTGSPGPLGWFSASRSRSPRCATTIRLRLHRLRQLRGLQDRPGPRGGEGRCLVRRSARSARSSRSSTRGRRRTSPSTTAGRRSATPSRRAQTPASRSRHPSCRSRRRSCGRGGPCSPLRQVGASRTRTSTPTCTSRAWSARPRRSAPSGTTSSPRRRRRCSTSTTSPARTSPTSRAAAGKTTTSCAPSSRRPSTRPWPPSRPGRPRCCGTPSPGSARR